MVGWERKELDDVCDAEIPNMAAHFELMDEKSLL
jgi:hypothetical protein